MIWLRRLFALPVVLFSYLAGWVVFKLWGETLSWLEGVMVVRLKFGSWMDKTWGSKWAGVAIGHSVIVSSKADERTLIHELIHVEQIEANAIGGLILGFFGLVWSPLDFLACWCFTPLFCYFGSFMAAVLRGEDPYMGSHLEEAAYVGAEDKLKRDAQ